MDVKGSVESECQLRSGSGLCSRQEAEILGSKIANRKMPVTMVQLHMERNCLDFLVMRTRYSHHRKGDLRSIILSRLNFLERRCGAAIREENSA